MPPSGWCATVGNSLAIFPRAGQRFRDARHSRGSPGIPPSRVAPVLVSPPTHQVLLLPQLHGGGGEPRRGHRRRPVGFLRTRPPVYRGGVVDETRAHRAGHSGAVWRARETCGAVFRLGDAEDGRQGEADYHRTFSGLHHNKSTATAETTAGQDGGLIIVACYVGTCLSKFPLWKRCAWMTAVSEVCVVDN